ncbi:ATP-dependent RNA helicase DeaD [Rhodoblastus acidophilus]|uniref:DEAD/DEAH box helicase n=1 Tax=Rhodoblastus acidophilus TaxID=1074 RepID=UPI00222472BF|nr:DEAD/DEAH box helicase [Rhodoblastus acidophilus]MCW2284597.1 ATP-dependent RNA helicase DeaD [Rhodoblastus acidophilus]MCW2333550.1 ATP-dependent RNA helicase DeaD [Rhodoblastus acidophilus]
MTLPDLPTPLARALEERAYATLTPVQDAVLRPDAAGRDLLVSAQTGSGKTVAFGLAMARDLLGGAERLPAQTVPAALVVAPTRELALQVAQELTWLYGHAGAVVATCVGGMNPHFERRVLAGGAHIVVGTPGRLRDHIERGALLLNEVKAVALDEADEMLDMGFREDLEFILGAAPESRRTLLFSATMPKGVAALAKKFQRDAVRVEVSGEAQGHADIEYRAVRVDPRDIEKAVVNLLRYFDPPTTIVFCNTREASRHLQAILQERGFSAVLLSGELGQHERNLSMQALRDGRAKVCVATDVAARGIDLPSVGLVIHADFPHDVEALKHRSGRTGRAGRKGVSALLIPPKMNRRAENLFHDAQVFPHWQLAPGPEEIAKLDRARIAEDPVFVESSTEEEAELSKSLLEQHGAEKCAAALAKFLAGRWPAAEELKDPGFAPPPKGERKEPRKRSDLTDTVWVRLPVGRSKRAEPKWILPMLCKKGGLRREDIGAIRIFQDETKVEIAAGRAEDFLKAMRKPGPDKVPAEPTSAPTDQELRARPKPRFGDKPEGGPREGKKKPRS